MVELLENGNTLYDNAIEMYFHEYFERRDISLQGLDYKSIDNSLYEGAFRYIYKKLFKPDDTTVRYNNKNTKIDLKNIDELNMIADIYIDIIKDFNITPFDYFFLALTGIHKDTFNSWKNEEYSHGGFSSLYSDLYKKIHILPQQQTRNKLVDDRIGNQSLANNDAEVALEYNNKRQIEEAVSRALTADQLPRLGNAGNRLIESREGAEMQEE